MLFWIVRHGTYKTGSSRRSGLLFCIVGDSMNINLEHPSLSSLRRDYGCLFLLNSYFQCHLIPSRLIVFSLE
jgi:hypothetical protein